VGPVHTDHGTLVAILSRLIRPSYLPGCTSSTALPTSGSAAWATCGVRV